MQPAEYEARARRRRRRRRRVKALLLSAATSAIYDWMLHCASSHAIAVALLHLPATRAPRKPRRRLNWDEHAKRCIDQGIFKRTYRMSLACFNKLVSILRPTLERDARFAGMRGGAVSVESRVAIAVRLLAGASYLDLLDLHGVPNCTLYQCLWSVVDAINASDCIGAFCFPGGLEECRKLAAAFKEKSQEGSMDGVVGAIDGLLVEIVAPSTSECLDQLSYYSGAKKKYGINVQAIATANYRFSCMTANHPGATNDFCAHVRSSLPELTVALPNGFYIVGDAAYPLSEKLLTPYAGKGLAEEYDVFNFHLSQVRIKVEQSFGILVQTWGMLWRPIRLGHAGRGDVITALFHLHNFLRDENQELVPFADEDERAQGLRPAVGENNRLPPQFKVPQASTDVVKGGETPTREALRRSMATLGLKRPAHNVARNSMIEA